MVSQWHRPMNNLIFLQHIWPWKLQTESSPALHPMWILNGVTWLSIFKMGPQILMTRVKCYVTIEVGSGYCCILHRYFNDFPLVESILERRFGNSLKKLHAECDSLRLKCNQSKRHLQEARKQMHCSSSQLDFLENIRHEPRFEDDVSFLLHISNRIDSLNTKM